MADIRTYFDEIRQVNEAIENWKWPLLDVKMIESSAEYYERQERYRHYTVLWYCKQVLQTDEKALNLRLKRFPGP